jgi:hypothetical protein
MIISELSGCEWSSHSSSLLCKSIALATSPPVGMIVRDAITGVKLAISELVESNPDEGECSRDSSSCSAERIALSFEGEIGVPDFSSVSVLDLKLLDVVDGNDSSEDGWDAGSCGSAGVGGKNAVSCPGNQCTAFVKHL